MSTFLELYVDVARGASSAGLVPTSVVGQTGRPLKLVEFTAEAWVRIQNLHPGWRWMQKTYGPDDTTTTASTSTYLPASFDITDLRDWKRDNPVTGYRPHTIYLTATGVSDERKLLEISWQAWRTMYGRGTQTSGYPRDYAITPAGAIALGPTPDDEYTVSGEYDQAAVRMTANADTPGLPDAFHQIIVNKALIMLHEDDEHILGIGAARNNYAEYLDGLERSQLPIITIGGGPIA